MHCGGKPVPLQSQPPKASWHPQGKNGEGHGCQRMAAEVEGRPTSDDRIGTITLVAPELTAPRL